MKLKIKLYPYPCMYNLKQAQGKLWWEFVSRNSLCHAIYMYFSFFHILLIHVQIETVGGIKERDAGKGVCGYRCQNLLPKKKTKSSLFNSRYNKADSSNCIDK